LTNGELTEEIRRVFGIDTMCSHPEWWRAKRSGPVFYYIGPDMRSRESGYVALKGAKLLARVRELLDIQEPGVRQGRLW
jgi:hypothetical protein